MSSTRRRGSDIEAAAQAHLARAGLRTLARNAAYRVGEVDLVMRDGPTVVFVEVRYRQHPDFGDGAESITLAKRRRIVRAAQAFLSTHPGLADAPCRFDVVHAHGPEGAPELHWIRDAFRADDI